MDFYSIINERRTIRDLQDTEIPQEVIQRILDAGLKAPTNDHMRSWEFVILTDAMEKARIISEIPKKRNTAQTQEFFQAYNMTDSYQIDMYMDAIPKQYSMLYHSGCLLLPFYRQKHPLLQSEELNSLNGFASIWCCIENILLAATAEGLGATLRIPEEREIHYLKEAIGHPDHYIMPCYIALGYPKEDAAKITQHEIDVQSRIHVNKW